MDNSSVEKRKYKRYNVTDFIVVIIDNKLGQLIDISENGLAIHLYNEDLKSLPEKCNSSLLTVAKGFLVEDLPLTLVRKQLMSSSPISILAAKFTTSDATKLRKIKEYISGLS